MSDSDNHLLDVSGRFFLSNQLGKLNTPPLAMSKKASPKKSLKPFTCCLCNIEIEDEKGNNPEPLFYEGAKRENKCCDVCNEVVIRSRNQIDIIIEQGVDECMQFGLGIEAFAELSFEIQELREKLDEVLKRSSKPAEKKK